TAPTTGNRREPPSPPPPVDEGEGNSEEEDLEPSGAVREDGDGEENAGKGEARRGEARVVREAPHDNSHARHQADHLEPHPALLRQPRGQGGECRNEQRDSQRTADPPGREGDEQDGNDTE